MSAAPRNDMERLPRSVRSLTLASFAVLTGWACGGAESESSMAPFTSEVRVLEGPDLRIGSVDDPDFAFSRVWSLAQLPDGGILTFHRQEQLIRRWTADGLPAGTIGGQGEGPGEFSSVYHFGVFGDTVWAMDQRNFRATYFDTEGEVLDVITVPTSIGEAGMATRDLPPRPERPYRDGSFYGAQPAFSHAIAEGDLTEVAHVGMSAAGEVTHTVWLQQFRPKDNLALMRENGGTFGRQPFGDGQVVVPHASGVVVLDRRAPASSDSAAVHVTRVGMRGDTVFRTALPFTPVPLSPEAVDSAVTETAEGLSSFLTDRLGIPEGTVRSDVRDAMYVPAFRPWATSLMPSEDGSTWVQLASSSRDGRVEWRVLDPRGNPAGTVFTPVGLRILRVDDESVLGVEADDLDVEYVVRYSIVDEAGG